MLGSAKGASLIELLLSISMTIMVVVTISLIFPRINKGIISNQNRSSANNLAASRLQVLKNMSYDLLDVTDASQFHVLTVNCNCQTDDFSVIPSTFTTVSGTRFEIQSCTNYIVRGMGNVWASQCPSAGDTGHKYITVHVRWVQGSEAHTVSQEFSKIRA